MSDLTEWQRRWQTAMDELVEARAEIERLKEANK